MNLSKTFAPAIFALGLLSGCGQLADTSLAPASTSAVEAAAGTGASSVGLWYAESASQAPSGVFTRVDISLTEIGGAGEHLDLDLLVGQPGTRGDGYFQVTENGTLVTSKSEYAKLAGILHGALAGTRTVQMGPVYAAAQALAGASGGSVGAKAMAYPTPSPTPCNPLTHRYCPYVGA